MGLAMRPRLCTVGLTRSVAVALFALSAVCSHSAPPLVMSALDAAGVSDAPADAAVDVTSDAAVDTAIEAGADAPPIAPGLPLVLVRDVALPGRATRFDYQEIDRANGHLVIAHMGDNEVLVVSLADGSTVGRIPNVVTARGIAVAPSIGRIFATSTSNQLVAIDAVTLREVGRVATGNAPDGVAWDPADQVVGVSDQRDGAISLVAGGGSGTRRQVRLGAETGNVVFDATRGRFWITVVRSAGADQLVGVDPNAATVVERIDLPGCDGAHGLRIHPDGRSALIACEGNSVLARLDLDSSHALVTAPTGSVPDVLSVDPTLGWLYVASEGGALTVFDLSQPGLMDIDDESPGPNAHSVAVDPATHRVYFPLMRGDGGTPVLRIMRPAGT